MKYVDEFRDRRLIDALGRDIREAIDENHIYNIMEVCGTHTMSIFRYGLRSILPSNIKLISGPGCPVCVTPNEFVDRAMAIAKVKDAVIATFGDMIKVPGSYSSLEKEKAKGSDIRVVYSSLDALEIAKKNPDKRIVFLGIGFETTAPTVAQSVIIAREIRIKNYFVLCGHKTMPEALEALVCDDKIMVDGFLLPGHVSAVTGTKVYGFLSKTYRKNCVASGFEPSDILQSILMLIKQKTPKVEIQYKRIIEEGGNVFARKAMSRVFEKTDSAWRGIGIIKKSGLKLRDSYKTFDAQTIFKPKIKKIKENPGCICGNVIKGMKAPYDCRLFSRTCTPETAVGACMVSSEGTCAAYYRYGIDKRKGHRAIGS